VAFDECIRLTPVIHTFKKRFNLTRVIMKLTYRGTSYDVPDPGQPRSNSRDLIKSKLIYRGIRFDYIPYPPIISEADQTHLPTVTLSYRGIAYQRKAKASLRMFA
jgi:hypothetical protein